MMTVTVETLIERSKRNMGAAHPRIIEYAEELIRRAYNEGIRVQISSGYRSNERQAELYGQGRSSFIYNGKQYGKLYDANGKKLSIVSNAKPGESVHNYGLAIDYFLVSEDGRTSLWTVNADWRRVAAIAKSMGFEWGGDWLSFVDYPHLQITGGLTISQLRAGQRPNIPPVVKAAIVQEVKVVERDINVVSSSLEAEWKEAVANGYFDGTRPGAPILREEAAVVTNRIRRNFKGLIQGLEERIKELEKQLQEK